MKNFIFILFLSFFGLCVSAQNSASATVNSRATVIDPIRIDKTVDLDFGNIISAYNPGQVILSPDGSRVAYGVQISNSIPGTVSPAEAVVTHGNNNYAITLPEHFTLYNQENPNQVLIIDRFTLEPQEGNITDIIKIGATLNLEANQGSGFYTNSSGFNVTVSYN
jgi:RNase H-fold protein (predicted Holliday junction resolvase)